VEGELVHDADHAAIVRRSDPTLGHGGELGLDERLIGTEPSQHLGDCERRSIEERRRRTDGRLLLPAGARRTLESRAEMRGIVQRGALVIASDGPGRRITIEARGRLLVPVWLRQRGPSMLVGAHTDIALLVIVPTELLDSIGDILTRAPR